MSEEERFDGILMSIVQQSAGIDGFFDAVFGFLRRRTDFFSEMSNSKFIHYLYLILPEFQSKLSSRLSSILRSTMTNS